MIQSKGGVWPYVMQGKKEDFVLGKVNEQPTANSNKRLVVFIHMLLNVRSFAAAMLFVKVVAYFYMNSMVRFEFFEPKSLLADDLLPCASFVVGNDWC